jgi:hypothetical protein
MAKHSLGWSSDKTLPADTLFPNVMQKNLARKAGEKRRENLS